jgi:hypothetical protein
MARAKNAIQQCAAKGPIGRRATDAMDRLQLDGKTWEAILHSESRRCSAEKSTDGL